jgi:putative hydrolase of the HAD superfamily
MSNMKAVIFDLFGTLVDFLSSEEWGRSDEAIASVLSVSVDEFRKAWGSINSERHEGRFGGLEGDVKHVCGLLGLNPTPAQVSAVVEIRLDVVRKNLKPKTSAVETLAYLRSFGFKTGLITGCPSEVPMLWEETSFMGLMDTLVFSSTARMSKPDPRIYRLACEQLSIPPEECIYVGDGGSYELSGAARVGMTPILIRTHYDEDYSNFQVEAATWAGQSIDDLREIPRLLGLDQ